MTATKNKPNPVRYSAPLLLLLTVCLQFAEHTSPAMAHSNWDLNDVMSKHSVSLPRETAYVVMAAIGGIGVLYSRRRHRKEERWNPRLVVILAVLLAWSALSVLWTETPMITTKRLFVVGLMFIGAVGLAMSWTQAQILRFIALSAAIQVAIGIVGEIVYGYFTPFHADYRFSGTVPANSEGYLCLVLTLAAICVAKMRPPDRWIYQALATYGFLFLLLTRSRGAQAALAVALTLYVLVTVDLRQKVLLFLLSGTIIVLLIMSGIGPAVVGVFNRGGEGSENLTGRAPLWEQLTTYSKRHPWVGYGFEGFWTDNIIADVSSEQGWSPDGAHSGYMECFLTLGFIGASLHTLALLAGFVEGIRLFLRTRGIAFFLTATFCLVYLTGGFLETMLIVKTSPISFYFALLLCITAIPTPRQHPRSMQEAVQVG